MDDQQSRNRRQFKNYLIHPKYQIKYVLWLAGSALLLTVVNCLIAFFFIRENYQSIIELVPLVPEVRAQLYMELRTIIFWLAFASTTFVVVISIIGLMISHKTAGALYHMHNVFKRVLGGDRNARVHLRTYDDFQEVAASFNQMMDSLTKK
ncbi:hypothetical protein K2X30_03575 [bacterium]|jgi:methyl-accepting chemotaxis protein|nr:hypothetical protein [bacterium]